MTREEMAVHVEIRELKEKEAEIAQLAKLR
jgi:hypothetical protein